MGMMINRRRACGGKGGQNEFVDMGLPSGTLWAKGNIVKDAQSNYSIGNETDYGCYFSWGNIDGHNEYVEDSYSFDQTNYDASSGSSLTGSISPTDALHDAAVARLGNGWHMPTKENFKELFNADNCTWEWTTVNSVNGYLVTSKNNGNTLFLPASGYCNGPALNSRSSYGIYWSSSIYLAAYAFHLSFNSGAVNPTFNSNRRLGFSMRPVK